ncbi:TetR/AcrR family transcriptional regulator [Nocardioides sp. URHA0020]|uniref:TetR/AcrR family transcriptional regulator n=1 Tax=Nocardioides sp. URHA0020 TaxID=1380392 RepID=UPI00048E51B4|nr:TetR/AcrR family transcriptional regulator [Nocardioides sp. URHA0020]
MGRPREHDLDTLLGHARDLWAEQGATALTIRALSARSGVSNGAIYNAFGSRANLLARVWAAEAEKFLTFQTSTVDIALAAHDAVGAVVAAALAPSDYVLHDEAAARLLLATSLDDLREADVSPADRERLNDLRATLSLLIRRLAEQLWDNTDPPAITLIKYCLVDLPSALLLAQNAPTDPLARYALEHAVRGIAAGTPPQR